VKQLFRPRLGACFPIHADTFAPDNCRVNKTRNAIYAKLRSLPGLRDMAIKPAVGFSETAKRLSGLFWGHEPR
jgi:hypothetical protein